jgi:hypothetical protein
MTDGFSTDRGMALPSWAGHGCRLETPQLRKSPVKSLIADRWCRTELRSRRGRETPRWCTQLAQRA